MRTFTPEIIRLGIVLYGTYCELRSMYIKLPFVSIKLFAYPILGAADKILNQLPDSACWPFS